MSSKILIFTCSNDAHLPFVMDHLRGEDVVVINPTDIAEGRDISYEFESGSMRVYYLGEVLGDVKSVWYRRPSPVARAKLPIPSADRKYAYSSLRKHIQALAYIFPESLWISRFEAIQRAEVKPLQQCRAAELGFNVPTTLYASSPQLARAFVAQADVCVAKTQAIEFPKGHTNYTKVVSQRSNLNYDGLRYDPYIFQTLIEPEAEIRVAVVGGRVFASSVRGQEIGVDPFAIRDWRRAHEVGTFETEPADIPRDTADKCVALTRALGLEFGAIDLILDKRGRYWFLEINPNGQWAFVDTETCQEIAQAIARRLKHGR